MKLKPPLKYALAGGGQTRRNPIENGSCRDGNWSSTPDFLPKIRKACRHISARQGGVQRLGNEVALAVGSDDMDPKKTGGHFVKRPRPGNAFSRKRANRSKSTDVPVDPTVAALDAMIADAQERIATTLRNLGKLEGMPN